jgi:L-iditol 2-dehydrogenase
VTLSKETFNQFMRLEVTLHGSWNSFSAPFPGDEWRTAADQLASGGLKWEFMITHELPLAELPAMMAKLGDRSEFSSKVIFVPNQG